MGCLSLLQTFLGIRKVSISAGVLIVGSLYWEDTRARKKWRDTRLNMKDQALVSAPIRYGRKSTKRGDSYTMVFSTELCQAKNHLGSGILVACRHAIYTVDDLVAEAEYLWAAEKDTEQRTSDVSATWGCIALLVNPKNPNIARLIDGWVKRIAQEKHYGKLERAHGESALVNADGQIAIPWPQRKDGKAIDTDILLLTATNPTTVDGRYATPEEIASAWKIPSGRSHVSYFWNNRKSGVETFQDTEIEALLNR